MYLKNNLNFRGNENLKEITFHKPGSLDKDLIIEVDDFYKTWDLFELLSSSYLGEDFEKWASLYNVKNEELEKIISFLKENNLVYKSKTDNPVTNKRMVNFLNNIYISDNEDEIANLMNSKKVLVIGVGTVGTAVIRYLLQLGVRKFVVIDGDIVEPGNIIHQHFYKLNDVGFQKVDVIKKNVQELFKDAEIITIPTYYNEKSQLDLVESIDAAFCCFDGRNNKMLQKIHCHFSNMNIPVYISGYVIGMVKAMELNTGLLEMNEVIENSITHQISDNSGIGLMGDLAAVVMCRLWLQKVIPALNNNIQELSYSFFANNSKADDVYRFNAMDINNTKLMSMVNEKNFIKNNKMLPHLLSLYGDYMSTKDEDIYQEIIYINDEYNLDLIEKNKILTEYEKVLSELYVNYDGKKYLIEDFSYILLREDNVNDAAIEQYNIHQEKLVTYAEHALKEKQINHYSDIKIKFSEKESIKKILFKISRELSDIFYGDKEVDYNEYKPYRSDNISYEQALDLICSIDKSFFTSSISEFVDYISKHKFISISNAIINPICVWNARYGSSEIILYYNNSGNDLMNLTHEIGHAYYNSFISKGNSEYSLESLLSETLAIMTEFKLIMTIVQTKQVSTGLYELVITRVYGALVSMFSLDLYEEAIMSLDNITIKNILCVRHELIKSFFPNKVITNDAYSELNITLSRELLFELREPFLYPESMLIGFMLAQFIHNDQDKEIMLINYLHNNKIQDLNIGSMLEIVFGILDKPELLIKAGDELLKFLKELELAERE